MQRSKHEPWSLETTAWLLICAFISIAQLVLTSCTPVKAVETGVRVDTDRCTEAGVRGDQTLLDCVSGGEVRVRIELARSAWEAAKRRDAGTSPAPATPAPYADAGVTLAIDGAHCKLDALDAKKNEVALLDCREGSVKYLVSIGREEWRAIEAKTIPAPYPTGPGK